jgi:hypothetical protein
MASRDVDGTSPGSKPSDGLQMDLAPLACEAAESVLALPLPLGSDWAARERHRDALQDALDRVRHVTWTDDGWGQDYAVEGADLQRLLDLHERLSEAITAADEAVEEAEETYLEREGDHEHLRELRNHRRSRRGVLHDFNRPLRLALAMPSAKGAGRERGRAARPATNARCRGSKRSSASSSRGSPSGDHSDPDEAEPPSRRQSDAPSPRFTRSWRRADRQLVDRIAALDTLGVRS